jgi:SpoIID/LytB domain protein
MARAGRHRHGERPAEEIVLPARHRARHAVTLPTLLGLAWLLVAPVGAGATDRQAIVACRAADITFYGRGWGHGVGMSQHGARGRALAGQSMSQILAHYYMGTTLGATNPAAEIRVLVLSGFAATVANPAIFHGRGGGWTIDGIRATFPRDATLVLAPTAAGAATWSLKVASASGTQLHAATVSQALALRPASGGSVFQVDSRPSSFDTYRGRLRILLTTKVSVVNELGLDVYLRGVVPAEMPSGWPTEALKAQAIAARSYSARRLRPGVGTFDVYDDTRSQVYRGLEGEAAGTNAAIQATSGIVLKSGSAIANALFHSTGGGATEHNENVFVSPTGAIVAGPVSYLRGSADRAPDGTPYDAAAPLATWKTASYSLNELSEILGRDSRTSVGLISRLDLSRRGVSGRLISVTLVGAGGPKRVSGDVFRSVFNTYKPPADPQLRSTLFDTRPLR